jgi:hypothetical protein
MVLADVGSSVADSWTAANRNRFPRSRQLHVQMYSYKCTVTCFMMTAFLLNVFSVYRFSPVYMFNVIFLRCGIR